MHAMRLFKPGGKARNGLSAFDPKLMRAMQRGRRQASPIELARNSRKTLTASGRLTAISKPR
jgi:hypothetical protein